MERQSTSKLFRALIAVVAFFVLCTSAILFASCGTDPLTCEHDFEDLEGSKVVAITKGTCGKSGTVTYECSKCGAEVTVMGTLATGDHKWVNDRCSVCGISKGAPEDLTLQQVKDDLTVVLETLNGTSGTDGLVKKIVDALSGNDFTIPSLEAKLEDIQAALDALDLNFDFDISRTPLTAAASNGATLGEVIGELYKKVDALYSRYAAENKQSLYDLLVGGTGETAHVHNWVLELKGEYSCTEPNTYVWGCSFCTETKPGDVIVKATGHATDYKHALQADGKTPTDEAVQGAHYFAATCIAPARVEGYCANCGKYTGEWNEIGQPTYQHHYVLETGADVEGNEGTAGSCTSVHQNVYHCETCGGAYVATTSSSSSKEHNYYYVADEDGSNKRAMTDDEKIEVWKKAYPDSTIKSLDQLSVSETQELNELLKEGRLTVKENDTNKTYTYGLNIVYYSKPTCVDPALIVVECMECGVRYAYTFGEPDGHVFEQVHEAKDSTCTMDGTKDYYYCDKCGYFFFFEDGDLKKTTDGKIEITEKDGKKIVKVDVPSLVYTREYMTDLDGKVINDLTDKAYENKAAYDMATAADPADGHDFVTVYINTQNCVTAQDYVLVCQRCFNGTEEFSKLVATKAAPNPDALFYQEVADKDKPYYLNKLTGNNITDKLAELLNGVIAKATKDDADATKPTDLTLEWNALDQTDKVSVFAWLAKHGYLVRDDKDDEVFGSISVDTATGWYGTDGKLKETAKTTINGYLAKLGSNPDLATLYSGYSAVETGTSTAKTKVASNMLLGPKQAKNDPDTKVADVYAFELPVVGHKFEDKFVLVVGNCVMYERHVRFCSECGQHTGDPDWKEADGTQNNPPFKSVTGDDDLVTAGYKSVAEAPKGYQTDLDLSWNKVKTLGDDAKLMWLLKYGYLKDYRDSNTTVDWSIIDPTIGYDGLNELMVDEASSKQYGAYVSELQAMQERTTILNPTLQTKDFFTHENVLDEFEVLYKFAGGQNTPVKLGHTFDVVTLIGEDQNCTDPGNYVYVCSACGLQSGATKSDLTYQSGKEAVKTGLKVVDSNKADFQSDEALFTAAIDPDNVGTEKGQYSKTDLQLEWEALTVMDKAGTTVDKAKTESAQLEWLLNHGYLNNVIDTYFTKDLEKLHTQKDYDDAKAAIYGTDGKLTATAKEAVFALAKELAKTAKYTVTGGTDGDITVYYIKSGNAVEDLEDACANKTIDFAATQIPQAGHLYTKGDGTPYDPENDPRCTDFADPVLTALYNNADASGKPQETGKVAKWNDTKKVWEDSGLTFNKSDLDSEFRAQADKYGILAACKRENCPLHSKATTPKNDKFTAGYIAAEPHLMSYEKFEAYPESSPFAGTPSPKIEDANLLPNERTHYNMKTADEYVGGEYPVEIGGDPVKITATNKQDAMDADLLNLYTLQKIYNYQHIDKATLDAHTELEYLEVEPGVKEDGNHTQDWMPLTRSETTNVYNVPSCWVSLRCYWYHYPVAQADGTYQEGTKCDTKNADTPHTLPKKGLDWNYNDNEANCQQGNLCIVCGFEMTSKTGHNLTDVSTLTGNTLKYWKKLFKDNYTGSHFGLEIGSTITVDGAEKEIKTEEELWDEIEKRFCEPTCCDEGHTIYVCTGELGVYGKAGDEGVFNAVEETGGLVKDKYNHYIGKTNSNATYYVETVKPTDEHNFKTYYFAINEKEIKIANAYDDETWNNGFNQIVCLEGYQEVEICVNKHREVDDPAYEGEELCEYYKTPIVHEAPQHTYAPVKEYWTEGHRFKAADPDNNKNAELEHVCVICGVTIYGEYGSVTGDGEYNVQYVQATKDQIDAWNANGTPDPAYGGKEKFEAQLVRTEDVLTGAVASGNVAADGAIFTDSMNVVNDDVALTLKGEGELGEMGSETTVVVAAGKTVTFASDATATSKGINLHGKVSFVGEEAGEGEELATVDFSAVGGLLSATNNVDLTFENVKVVLNDTETEGDTRLAIRARNNTFTFKNSIVESKDTPFGFNKGAVLTNSKIVIEDSVFVSTDEIALSIWNNRLSIVATNSVFAGKWAGAYIRSGSANFTDCTFATIANQKGANGDGAQIDKSAALIAGNWNSAASYGNANVTLTNCNFKLVNEINADELAQKYMTVALTETECTEADPAIAVVSTEKNSTTVTLDPKSYVNATFIDEKGGYTSEDGKTKTFKVVLPQNMTAEAFGETEDEQKATAAKLVESLATKGGYVALPQDLSFSVSGDSSLEIPAGVELEIDIGEGSQVDLAKGLDVKGKLTVEGDGTLLVQKRTSGNVGVLVDGANAELNIKGGNLSVSSGENVNGAPYAIYAKNGATVNVSNSVVYSSVGKVLGTNAQDTTSAKFILINSAFINDTKTADASEGSSFAVLVNNKNAEIYAGGCTFYGTSGAVWVRAAKKAVFAGCTFVGGGVASTETKWGAGATLPKEVLAVLVIGNGQGDAYGAVDAMITDCTVETVTAPANGQGQPAKGVETFKYEYTDGKLVKGTTKEAVPGYGKSATATIADANTKLFSVVAYNSTTTTVAFSDLDTAKAFIGGEALTKGTNAFFCGTATRKSFDVKYDTTSGTEEPTYASIKINEETAPDAETAEDTLKDVLANGGELTLTAPEAEAQGKTLTVSGEALTVAKVTTIKLNGNTLEVTNGIKVSDETALTVEGGSVTANVTVLEEGNVTLNDVDLTGGINLTYPAQEEATASTAHITLTDSTVTCSGTETADTPLYVNGNVDGATVTLTDSVFLSNNGLGLWIAGKTTIVATNCLFYGSVAAVQVCSGDVTFENCTFVTSSDDKWTTDSGEDVTWLGSGSNGFPNETRANLVINAKGGGYDAPVTVTVKGEKTEFAVLEKGTDYAPSNVLKAGEADETKTTKLENFNYYYKKAAEATVSEISVAVVSAKASEATSALVKLTVTDVKVAFKLGQNVFVYTTLGNADSKTAAAEDKTVTVVDAQKVIKGLTELGARAE